jgi:predicted RND superfamily exporter protein
VIRAFGVLDSRRPWVAIGIVTIVTLVLGVFAAQQRTDTDITAFAPETAKAKAFTRIQDEFATGGGNAQVIVAAGEGGSVVSAEGVLAALIVQQVAETDPAVALALAPATPTAPAVVSYATPIAAGMIEAGIDPLSAPDEQVLAVAAAAYASEEGAFGLGLLSQDADPDVPAAEAGLVVVQFRPDLDDIELQEVGVALRDALAVVDVPGVSIDVFSVGILYDELQGDVEEELPPLLGLSFLLIIAILAFIYRSVSDVLLGIVGLLVSIVWMYGIGVLLGPDYLGLVGAFTQISIVVPVLLVGLGIDYAVHLTSRYREERGSGAAPDAAARTAVLTVGAALVLATITTLIGFLTNVASPLPPIGDFGVFAAAGVLSAFVVMGLLVPSARNLLDRRRHAAGRSARADRTSALAGVLGRAALLTEHVPVATMIAAALITAVSVWTASGISTQFSQEEFIPEDSESARLIGLLTDHFGGDITEETYVLVEGDLADPGVANAILAFEAGLSGIPDVRTVRGRAQATSPGSVVLGVAALAAESDPDTAQRLVALGVLSDGSGFSTDADMAAVYDTVRAVQPGALVRVLSPADDAGVVVIATTAGEDRVTELEQALEDRMTTLQVAGVETTVTSQGIVIQEVLDRLTASQTRSIVLTLAAALVLLVGFYWVTERRPMLGLVTMLPSLVVVAWTLGTMRLMGLSFNVLTATVASLAIGIGVPYGIHVTHRFLEDREREDDVDEAIRLTVTHTGSALTGAALTTAAGFGVLVFASLLPIRQFGTVIAITIVYSLAAAVLVQPSGLVLWDRWHAGRTSGRSRQGSRRPAGPGMHQGAGDDATG